MMINAYGIECGGHCMCDCGAERERQRLTGTQIGNLQLNNVQLRNLMANAQITNTAAMNMSASNAFSSVKETK